MQIVIGQPLGGEYEMEPVGTILPYFTLQGEIFLLDGFVAKGTGRCVEQAFQPASQAWQHSSSRNINDYRLKKISVSDRPKTCYNAFA
jgi:hypothetical protein